MLFSDLNGARPIHARRLNGWLDRGIVSMPAGSRSTGPHNITLYAKAGCHLCDEARDYLEELVAHAPDGTVELSEIDIRRDEALFERYRYRIPVITVDGVECLEGRITPDEVATLLDTRRPRGRG